MKNLQLTDLEYQVLSVLLKYMVIDSDNKHKHYTPEAIAVANKIYNECCKDYPPLNT